MGIVTSIVVALIVIYVAFELFETYTAATLNSVPPAAGPESDIGARVSILDAGSVRDAGTLTVTYRGEIWNARIAAVPHLEPRVGQFATIREVDGLVLVVEPDARSRS